MRRIREVTAEEENFRIEDAKMTIQGHKFGFVRRNPVEPEPSGTIILIPFRLTGYDPDCDGSLMARLEAIDLDELETTGAKLTHIGLYPPTGFVVTEDELRTIEEQEDEQTER